MIFVSDVSSVSPEEYLAVGLGVYTLWSGFPHATSGETEETSDTKIIGANTRDDEC